MNGRKAEPYELDARFYDKLRCDSNHPKGPDKSQNFITTHPDQFD